MQQHFKINYDKFLVYAFVIQDKNLETLWNLENVAALIDFEIQISSYLMHIFTQRKHHVAKNNLISVWTAERCPVETGVSGAVATTLFNR